MKEHNEDRREALCTISLYKQHSYSNFIVGNKIFKTEMFLKDILSLLVQVLCNSRPTNCKVPIKWSLISKILILNPCHLLEMGTRFVTVWLGAVRTLNNCSQLVQSNILHVLHKKRYFKTTKMCKISFES